MRNKLLGFFLMIFSFSLALALPSKAENHKSENIPSVGQAQSQLDQAQAQKSQATSQAENAAQQSTGQGVQQTQELAEQLRQSASSVAGVMSQEVNSTR